FARGPNPTLSIQVPNNTPAPSGQTVATANFLPIVLSSINGVQSADIDLVYDSRLLTINNVTLGPAFSSGYVLGAPSDNPIPGTTLRTRHIGVAGSPNAGTGAPPIVLIRASVPNGPPSVLAFYGDQAGLDPQNLLVNGLPADDDDGVQVDAYFGDVDGNPLSVSNDAGTILNVNLVPATAGFAQYPQLDPRILADVDGLPNGGAPGVPSAN